MAQITIKGTKELQNLLKNIGTAPLERTIKKVTVEVQEQAKALAPARKIKNGGALKNSIKMNYDSNKKEGRVYTNLEYATYVEFGTGIRGNGSYPDSNKNLTYNQNWKGQVAQPYMYPALQFGKSKAQEILKQEIENEIKGGS